MISTTTYVRYGQNYTQTSPSPTGMSAKRPVNAFIIHCLKDAESKATTEKALGNFRTITRWSVVIHYTGTQAGKIDWSMQKKQKRPVSPYPY